MRRARPDDRARLTRLAHDAKRFWGYSEELIRLWRTDLTVTRRFIADHAVYCALHDSRIVGFYALSGAHGARDLEHMWVDPKHIGCGVGRSMFAHLLRHLRRVGVARLTIASDPNAEGFYRKLGARRVGSVPSTPAGRHLPLLEVCVTPAAIWARRAVASGKRVCQPACTGGGRVNRNDLSPDRRGRARVMGRRNTGR